MNLAKILDGPAIRIANQGDSHRESIRRKKLGDRDWATPKPSHNKPHVLSWAVFLSEGFRASVRAIPSQEPATLVLKRGMGVRGSTQGPPLGDQIPPKLTSDRPALI